MQAKHRSRWIRSLAALAAGMLAIVAIAQEKYPSRPIEFIVP